MNNFKEYNFFNHSLSGEILKEVEGWYVGYVASPAYIEGELHNNIQGVIWFVATGECFIGNRPKSDFNLYSLNKGEN